MSVHQSPRRHSARLQNAYEDGTDEDEQDLFNPADRFDHRVRAACSAMGSRRSSPQEQHPHHTQFHASSRMFADPRCARNDLPAGPARNAPVPAHNAGGYSSGTAHADPAHNAGEAIPGTLYADPAHNAGEAAWPLSSQPRYQSHTRTSGAHGTYFRSTAAKQPAYSSYFEPTGRYEDLEQQSAFYRNADPYAPSSDPLPPLDLPKFDGNIRQYRPFREAFAEAIGLNSTLRPLNKLLYLRQHLRGEPLALAEKYSLTDANYAHVIRLLDRHFGDRGRLLFALQEDLFRIQPPSEGVQDLRRFHLELDAIQSALRYAGENLDSSSMWAMVIAKKLPTSLRVKLVDSYGYQPYSLSTTSLLECLDQYVANLEWASNDLFVCGEPADDAPNRHSVAVDTSDLSGPQCREDPELAPVEPPPQSGEASAVTTIADKPLEERQTCPLCGRLHSAADCTVYDTAKKRTRRVLKLKLCLLCLREGHPAASCPRRTTQPCKICRHGQHSRALCLPAADEKPSKPRRPSPVCATKGSTLDPEASDQRRQSRSKAPATTTLRIAELSVNRAGTTLMPTASTLRQSGTQSSRANLPGNLMNRKKRSGDLGTDPPGRPGTNRPPTTSTDESMKQYGAEAYGGDRLLPGRYSHLQTDKCSIKRETLQLDRATLDGSEDADDQYELYEDEDFSLPPSIGHCSDYMTEPPLSQMSEDGFPPYEESATYISCAVNANDSSRCSHTTSPPEPERSTSRYHDRLREHCAYPPAHNAGGTTGSSTDATRVRPAHNAGETAVPDNTECPEPSNSTSIVSRQLSTLSRVSGAVPQTSQKQRFTNPLDAQLLLLPTSSTTHVEVEEVSAAHNAVGLPRPVHAPLSTTEAEHSSPTAESPAKAKPPATKQPNRPPGHRAHAQAGPSGPQCRSVTSSCGMSGHSRGSGPQCRSSRTRNREPAQAVPLVRTTSAPLNSRRRGPRADLFDQELRAAFPPPTVSDCFTTTLHQATRATQEPLKLLAPAQLFSQTLPQPCAFCERLHQSRECYVYATVCQRLRGTRLLELCFSCLGQDHRSSSCWQNVSVCTACYAGQHNEAFCRLAATAKCTSSVRVNDRNDCPPKNETTCFCDASTFQQFGRQLRSGVQIATPMFTPADATNFVCSFRPTSEVKRVLLWFSGDPTSMNHVELVRLVTELSHYYTTHYQSILQYVVVSTSVSSSQDAWTHDLVQAQVLLPDARLSMLPHGLLVRNDNDRQAIDVEEPPSFRHPRDGTPNSSNAIEDVKHCLREQTQLDLWSCYLDDCSAELATDKVAAHNATSKTPSTACASLAAAHNAVATVRAQPPITASTAEQNLRVQDSKAATDAGASTQVLATPDAATSSSTDAPTIAAPAASQAAHATATDIEARIAQLAADLAALKDLLPKPTVTSGISAPTRPPDPNNERGD